MGDLISRQAAIDAADRTDYTGLTVEDVKKVTDEVVKEIKKLPSAQPTQTDTSNTLKALDCVERQAAIDALKRNTLRLTVAEEWNCEGHVAWDAEVVYSEVMEGMLLDLPSAQPEPCEDAVSRTFMYELGATCIAKPDGNGNLIALGRIDMLPPVTPKRKTGKWNFIGNQMFECSECGTCYTQSQFYQMRVRISDTEFPKFCPNCGADMRGEQK